MCPSVSARPWTAPSYINQIHLCSYYVLYGGWLRVWQKYLQITVFIRAVDPLRDAPAKSSQTTCNGQLVFVLLTQCKFIVEYMNLNIKFKISADFRCDIWSHFVAATLLSEALFIETVKVMSEEEKKTCIWGEMGMCISSANWKRTQCKQACVCVTWCFMLHT